MTVTTTTSPYEAEPVISRVLAPFDRWAAAGYAEGVLDFVPSLGRIPILLMPSSVSQVFSAAFDGMNADEATEEDKTEVARRIEFVQVLMDELMTRENVIRDRYYAERQRGVIHRTIAMMAGMGVFTASAVSLPLWASACTMTALVAGGVAAYRRCEIIRRNVDLPEDRGLQIVRELPWISKHR